MWDFKSLYYKYLVFKREKTFVSENLWPDLFYTLFKWWLLSHQPILGSQYYDCQTQFSWVLCAQIIMQTHWSFIFEGEQLAPSYKVDTFPRIVNRFDSRSIHARFLFDFGNYICHEFVRSNSNHSFNLAPSFLRAHIVRESKTQEKYEVANDYSIFISRLQSHPWDQSLWFGCLVDMSLAPIKPRFFGTTTASMSL